MIVYKVDKLPNAKANSQIHDMSNVLKEVATTWQVLKDAIDQQESALSSPSINNFRNDLQLMISDGIRLAEAIAENSEKLVMVSEQASKHLTAIEDHFSAALQKHAAANA